MSPVPDGAITSARNPLARLIRSLHKRAARDDLRLAFVEGERLVAEALACGAPHEAAEAMEGGGAGAGEAHALMDAVDPTGVYTLLDAAVPAEAHALLDAAVPAEAHALMKGAGAGLVRRLCMSVSFTRDPASGAIAAAAASAGIPTDVFADSLFDSICDTQTPQGVLAVIGHIDSGMDALLSRRPPCGRTLVLALDCVQDPGNVGGMIRTAAASGFSGVVLGEGCADLHAPKTLRASMGAAFRMPLARVPSLPVALEAVKASGARVYAAVPHGGASLFGADLPQGGICLVVGNEGAGVSGEVMAMCDGALSLPMAGDVESLNVCVAAGIFMYGMTSMRNYDNDIARTAE